MNMESKSPTPATPRIDPQDPGSLDHWSREFAVSELQVVDAVRKVGDKAAEVEMYLKGSRSSTNADALDEAGGESAA